MKRRIVWLVVSCLMVVALLLAACAPAPVEEEAPAVPAVKEEVPAVKETAPAVKETAPAVKETAPVVEREAPQYGGVLRLAQRERILQLSQTGAGGHTAAVLQGILAESGYTNDWAKGPSGTGEFDFYPACIIDFEMAAPALVVDWKMPDPETIIFRLREGVRFHNKPPVNGRELDATDVIRTQMSKYWEVKDHNNRNFLAFQKAQSMKALDKYTIETKIEPGSAMEVMRVMWDWTLFEPRETLDLYPLGTITDWRHLIGTGPFILTDHVEEACSTFVRNPDYWGTDPLPGPGKGNQLPYVDGLQLFVIADVSTRLAALRTAKIDQLEYLTLEQVLDLRQHSPELKSAKWLYTPIDNGLSMWQGAPPFNDVRVRRALSMAIDREAIGRDIRGGEYNLLTAPVAPASVYVKSGTYIPLEELPRSVQELFEYHPDKARQLLIEAGYPQGFQTKALAYSTEQIDMLSIVAEYFAAINVKLTIDVKEYGVYTTLRNTRRYDGMIIAGLSGGNPYRFHPYRSITPGASNAGGIIDPLVDEMYLRVQTMGTPLTKQDWYDRAKDINSLTPHILEQAYFIELPSSFEYVMWWPWLKNYSGEYNIQQHRYPGTWAHFVWIDQALKKTILGK